MARLQLNKSSLALQGKNLATYRRFLPSLDLKRQQLMAQRNLAREQRAQTQAKIEALTRDIGDKIPMLANYDVQLDQLVTLKHVAIVQENIVGTYLPKVDTIKVEVMPYSPVNMPHWVDNVVEALKAMLALKAELKVMERRVELLDKAVKTITQRVNLFEKVLIPQTQANIKRIKIYLSDEQMAAVVRSKIAKRKRQEASEL